MFRIIRVSFLALACLFFAQQAFAGRYLITIKSATITAKKSEYKRWDTGWGDMTLPDVYVQFDLAGVRMITRSIKNSTKPSWTTSKSFVLSGNEKVYIKVFDKDLSGDDLIGKTSVSFATFQNNEKKGLSFGKVTSFKYKIEALGGTPAPTKRAAPAKRETTPTPPPARREAAPVKREAAPAKREAAPAKREAAPAKREAAPPAKREATPPPVRREAAPVKREAAPVKREAAPVKREAAPAKREVAPVKRAAAPAKRDTAPPAKREATPPAKKGSGSVNISAFCRSVTGHAVTCMQASLEKIKADPKKAKMVGFIKAVLGKLIKKQDDYIKKCSSSFQKEQDSRKKSGKASIQQADLDKCWSCLKKAGCDRSQQKVCKAICSSLGK